MDDLILYSPVEEYIVTQPFGVNPQNYQKWGLPSHEGIDFRAPTGSKIFACAPGVVYRLYYAGDGNPYGNNIRLRHEINGEYYQTIYAHLQRFAPGLALGDEVQASQVIGYADSTGNSTGSHLHLTLKHEGQATPHGHNIIDPTPYMRPYHYKGLRKHRVAILKRKGLLK